MSSECSDKLSLIRAELFEATKDLIGKPKTPELEEELKQRYQRVLKKYAPFVDLSTEPGKTCGHQGNA